MDVIIRVDRTQDFLQPGGGFSPSPAARGFQHGHQLMRRQSFLVDNPDQLHELPVSLHLLPEFRCHQAEIVPPQRDRPADLHGDVGGGGPETEHDGPQGQGRVDSLAVPYHQRDFAYHAVRVVAAAQRIGGVARSVDVADSPYAAVRQRRENDTRSGGKKGRVPLHDGDGGRKVAVLHFTGITERKIIRQKGALHEADDLGEGPVVIDALLIRMGEEEIERHAGGIEVRKRLEHLGVVKAPPWELPDTVYAPVVYRYQLQAGVHLSLPPEPEAQVYGIEFHPGEEGGAGEEKGRGNTRGRE